MNPVVRKDRFDSGSYTGMKVSKRLATGEPFPVVHQRTARGGGKIGVDFGLGYAFQDWDANFFQSINDLWIKFLRHGDSSGCLFSPHQRTAVEGDDRPTLQMSSNKIGLPLSQKRETGVAFGFECTVPVRFAVPYQNKLQRQVFAGAGFSLFLCHKEKL